MGVLTDSKLLREKMLNRNIYSADHPYGLGNDILTKTLDTFAKLGMDLRTSTLLAGAERLIDNTKLSVIGLERLAVEIGRRTANNVFRQEVGSINVDNIFSKDPNKTVITKATDYSITPQEKPTDIISYLKQAAGYESTPESITAGKETNREEAMGGKAFYDNLGVAQKALLHGQLAQNRYIRYPNGGDPYAGLRSVPGRYSTVEDTYSKEFLDKRSQTTSYGTYILEDNLNSSLDTQTNIISNVTEAVNAGVNNMLQVQTEGFGRTSLPNHNTVGEVPDSERFFQYGQDDSNLAKFGIERGLLYYTQKIANGGGPIGNALDREAIQYGTGERNAVVYRGSGPCRNFTMQFPLESFGQAIRFEGNGNPESVVGASVMPRIHPISRESGSQNLMFTIENLAYSREDLIGMPANEKGPNQGRIMWFPPYALQYSISHQAKWDATELLGRIEPIYTYGGVTRAVSISFMLLIDTPPNVANMHKEDMAQWFWGCQPERGGPIDELEPITPDINIAPPAKIKPKPADDKPDRFPGTLPLYYFQNNIHDIQEDYEVRSTKGTATEDPRNLFGLNAASFFPNVEPLLRYINDKRKNNRKVRIRIEGRCSALFTDLYNANLSYRRAASLKDYILSRYQALFGETITLMNDVHAIDFITGIDLKNLGKTYVLQSKDGSIEIEITGKGEKFADARSDERREINDKYTKQRRLAGVTSCRSEPLKPRIPTIEPPATPELAVQRKNTSAKNDATKKQSQTTNSSDITFRNQYSKDTVVPTGWEYMDYYAPVFHSQTPYDMYKRRQFLQQLMFPGDTAEKTDQIGSNSLFGRMPVCIIRIADELHSKAIINNLTLDITESTWDTNPEGMGMQAMFLKVTIDANLIGGMALKNPVNRLQTATDFNHIANSSFHSEPYYSKERWDYKRADHGDAYRQADSRATGDAKK